MNQKNRDHRSAGKMAELMGAGRPRLRPSQFGFTLAVGLIVVAYTHGHTQAIGQAGPTDSPNRKAKSAPSRTGSSHQNDTLRDELLAMMEKDQQARRRIQRAQKANGGQRKNHLAELISRVLRVDKRNTKRMKQIVDLNGWPTRSMVGDDGARAAWLLVQHADRDVAFQRRCLKLMHPFISAGEVFPDNVAYLTDRVLCNEGKPQVYGTQFRTIDGKLQPLPMIDPKHVDRRRKAMGLSSLAAYTEVMRASGEVSLPGDDH